MSTKKAGLYHSLLLRRWQEGGAFPDEDPTWRYSVEEVADERRRWGFGNLEDVLAFLRIRLADNESEESAVNDD